MEQQQQRQILFVLVVVTENSDFNDKFYEFPHDFFQTSDLEIFKINEKKSLIKGNICSNPNTHQRTPDDCEGEGERWKRIDVHLEKRQQAKDSSGERGAVDGVV